MGLFDRFKGESVVGRPEGAGRRPAPRFGLDDAVKAYGLQETEPYEPSIVGPWWEGQAGVTRFAVVDVAGRLFVHIGTVAEIAEIYLGRATDKQPLPPAGSPGRIDAIVKGHPVAQQFFLVAYPSGPVDHPQLRLPGAADALARLSPAVSEVMISDNMQGVTLVWDRAFSRADFDRDLAAGVELVKALASGERT